MAEIESSFWDIRRLDTLAFADSPIHRLDPRVKILTTLVYIVTVVSFPKYAVSALLPFLLYPVVISSLGRVPLELLARKMLPAALFAFAIGIFNPLLDRAPLFAVGPLCVSGGMVSFCSIMLRVLLTVSAALLLIATTGMEAVGSGLERLGAPKGFVVQLLFLYRYIFVLGDTASRMARARDLRSFGRRGTGIRSYATLLGHLLLRTMDRAQNIHQAMLCRGFDGEIRLGKPMRLRAADTLFLLLWSVLFLLLRQVNLSRLLGALATGLFS
ncbi:MAG: cobalt ECF transporter T component CbiQ [Thermodesulfobacteriota bacterium]